MEPCQRGTLPLKSRVIQDPTAVAFPSQCNNLHANTAKRHSGTEAVALASKDFSPLLSDCMTSGQPQQKEKLLQGAADRYNKHPHELFLSRFKICLTRRNSFHGGAFPFCFNHILAEIPFFSGRKKHLYLLNGLRKKCAKWKLLLLPSIEQEEQGEVLLTPIQPLISVAKFLQPPGQTSIQAPSTLDQRQTQEAHNEQNSRKAPDGP
ncbi:hypothetical protein E2320_020104 [Naja naja]|nr:hypothetical protein E2320_020104 [Naja naja]